MKYFAVVISFLLLIQSCTNPGSKAPTESAFKPGPLDSVYTKLRPQVQIFSIDNNKVNTVKAANSSGARASIWSSDRFNQKIFVVNIKEIDKKVKSKEKDYLQITKRHYMPVSQKVILPVSSSKPNWSRWEEGIADIMVAWVSNSRRSFGISFCIWKRITLFFSTNTNRSVAIKTIEAGVNSDA